MKRRMTVYYSGMVQGVGFRYTVRSVVGRCDVRGSVRNLNDGRVELIAEGSQAELEALSEAIRHSSVGRFIKNEQVMWNDALGDFDGFQIVY